MELVSAPIHPDDERKTWDRFPLSFAQRMLHNALVAEVTKCVKRLETVAPEELHKLQGQIAGLRQALDILHKKDTPHIKELYASGKLD